MYVLAFVATLGLLLGACVTTPSETASSSPAATGGKSASVSSGICGAQMSTPTWEAIPDGTPEGVRAFYGKWGEAYWNSTLCHVLMISKVTTDGTAKIFYITGRHGEWNINTPSVYELNGKIVGDKLSLTRANGDVITYTLKGGKLHGNFSGRGGATIVMDKTFPPAKSAAKS